MEPHFTTSPRWSPTTKLLVGLVVVGIMAFLFIRFTSLITPLLMVFILAYLLHPVATMISFWLRVSWRAAVNILYFIILILVIGSLTLGGVGLVGQVQSLIQLIQTIVADLPKYVEALSGQVFQIGPIRLDMRTIDLNAISSQLLSGPSVVQRLAPSMRSVPSGCGAIVVRMWRGRLPSASVTHSAASVSCGSAGSSARSAAW